MGSNDEMSTSFGSAAGAYETGRPDYPIQAVDWMLQAVAGGERRIRVADVGAGTGKLTRSAVELNAEVVAIDPDPQMLAVLREHVHGVPTFLGTAEDLPIPDASVDAVLLGQAWHWVDPAAGSREIARVLRPGGVLGLIWNIRDESVPWVARLTEILRGSNAELMLADGDPPLAAPFPAPEHAHWNWSRPMTRDSIFAMARSRSYIITAEPDERARIEAGLTELLDEIGVHGGTVVELPYVTHAFRAVRP